MTRTEKIVSGETESLPADPAAIWAWVRYAAAPAARDGSSPTARETACTALVQDMSDESLVLSLTPRIEPGTELHLELRGRPQLDGLPVTARVQSRAERPGGGWLVACAWRVQTRIAALPASV